MAMTWLGVVVVSTGIMGADSQQPAKAPPPAGNAAVRPANAAAQPKPIHGTPIAVAQKKTVPAPINETAQVISTEVVDSGHTTYYNDGAIPARKPGLLSKLNRMFRSHKEPVLMHETACDPCVETVCDTCDVCDSCTVCDVCDPCQSCDPCMTAEVVATEIPEPVAKLEPVPTEIVQTSANVAPEPIPAPKEVPPAPAPKAPEPVMSHDPAYAWLQGTLHYVKVKGGVWVVRYMPLDKADKYGGSMVLSHDARLQQFHEGDIVRIEGEVLNERSSKYLGGAHYRIREISMMQSAASTGPSLR